MVFAVIFHFKCSAEKIFVRDRCPEQQQLAVFWKMSPWSLSDYCMANKIGKFYRYQLIPIVVGLSEKQRSVNERIFRTVECLQSQVPFNDQKRSDRVLLNGDFPDLHIWPACTTPFSLRKMIFALPS